MPTLTNDLAKQTSNQQAVGEGTLSMNFEMYDKAENVNVNLCAKRAADCMAIEKEGGKVRAMSYDSESPNNDKVVKVAIKQSFGINPQGGQMLPFDKECGETLAIGHQG